MRVRAGAAAVALACLSTFSVAGCSSPSEPTEADSPAPETAAVDREDVETQTTTTTPTQASPTLSAAQQRVPADLREKVASLMVVGVSNYDQARFALDQGVLLRPLGSTVYVLPPYGISAAELDRVWDAIAAFAP